jgi:predicted TPR repeat methyltransferase
MNRAGTNIERAVELHRGGRLAEAESMYLKLLGARRDDADALHFLGMLRMQQGRPGAAVELMQRSLKFAPANAHAWNNMGNVLMAEGRDEEAQAAYTRATHLAPKMAEAWFNLGILFRRKRMAHEALRSFRAVLDSNPRFSGAYESLGMLLYRMGRSDHAADVYRKWLEVEPGNPVARHMHAATSGQSVPTRAEDRYVRKIFDDFAASFDRSLEGLEYAAPRLLSAALAERIDFGRAELDILDAGCGTGLCGLLLRSSARSLVGVDLSAGMLAKARDRGIYDELVESELCRFMRSRPAAFDLINCADTLVYFGALGEAADAARASLRPGGLFGFTVEAAPEKSTEPFAIQTHGRYVHSGGYLEATLGKAGFAAIERESVILRKERGEDVPGHLIIARAARGRLSVEVP